MRDVVKTSVKRQTSTRRRHRRSRLNYFYFILVIFLVLGIAVALSITLFFNISTIVVRNETDTPDTRIVEFSGIEYHDNLVRLDTAVAEQKIWSAVAYAEKVEIRRKFPSTVEITVTKAEPIVNVTNSYGHFLLVSASGRVLEDISAPREDLIIISGYNAVEGEVGMMLVSEDDRRTSVFHTLTAAVAECSDANIRSIDMEDQSDILVQFGENIVFHMGNSNDALYKLRLAAKTIEQINPDKRYRLTMVGNNQISVVPEESGAVQMTLPESTAVSGEETTTSTT